MPSLSQLVPPAAAELGTGSSFHIMHRPRVLLSFKTLDTVFTLWYHLEMLMWGFVYSGACPPPKCSFQCFVTEIFLEFIFKPLIMCKGAWQTHCPCTCPQSQEESNGFLSG